MNCAFVQEVSQCFICLSWMSDYFLCNWLCFTGSHVCVIGFKLVEINTGSCILMAIWDYGCLFPIPLFFYQLIVSYFCWVFQSRSFTFYCIFLFVWLQGGLTATDVFAVEWIQSGVIHFGTTVSYFGFVSDGNFSCFQCSISCQFHLLISEA